MERRVPKHAACAGPECRIAGWYDGVLKDGTIAPCPICGGPGMPIWIPLTKQTREGAFAKARATLGRRGQQEGGC